VGVAAVLLAPMLAVVLMALLPANSSPSVSWQLKGGGTASGALTYEKVQASLITLTVADSGVKGRSTAGPRTSVSCTNEGTQEVSTLDLAPISVQDSNGTHLLTLSLANQWLGLPYPVDAGTLESKPAAIIEQKTGHSAYGMPAGELRARFADVAQYMLITAGHHYGLPLGDGLLSCRFSVIVGDSAATASSAPMLVQFGRGLPTGTYSRDHSVPMAANRPTWLIDAGFTRASPLAPVAPNSAEARAELDELLKLQGQRTPSQLSLIRYWDNGSAVGPWIEITLSNIATHALNPPRASRALGLVSVAVNDAVVAQLRQPLDGRPQPCKLDSRIKPLDGDCEAAHDSADHAVVAGAASAVLAYLFPDNAGEFERLAQQDVEAQLQAGTAYRSELGAGLALGDQVGALAIARAQNDGSSARWTGYAPQGPQYWVPTLPAYAPPMEPLVGTWRTWNLTTGSQFRPGPPPAPGSPQYEADLREVYDQGSHLTIEKQELCSYWEDKAGSFTPSGHWNVIALQLVRAKGLSTPDAALDFATLNTAQADSFIATWDTKYAYWSVRPITAIRKQIDANWQPYIYTPPFPSYVSGHSTTSSAASEVLAHFFPDSAQQLRKWAQDAAVSRLYGGIHFRTDNEVGLKLGAQVAGVALTRVGQAGMNWRSQEAEAAVSGK
jgi:hypothetical protein